MEADLHVKKSPYWLVGAFCKIHRATAVYSSAKYLIHKRVPFLFVSVCPRRALDWIIAILWNDAHAQLWRVTVVGSVISAQN